MREIIGDLCHDKLTKSMKHVLAFDETLDYAKWKGQVRVEANILSAKWLDNDEKIEVKNNSFQVVPFRYSRSYFVRVAKLIIEE